MNDKNPSACARPGRAKKRRHRTRPTPRQLEATELDEIAKRRCLMLLQVLSGQTPVTDAIAAAKISRGTYYQLENRALAAMLRALMPGCSEEDMTGHARQIEALQAKIAKLEKDKRRLERLLQMTSKVIKPGALTTGKGRPPKRASARAGSSASRDSKTKKAISPSSTPSTPKRSADEP